MRNGYTLVELLLIIAVIVVISTIGFVMYSTIQPRTRDARRKADIAQIKDALEQYKIANGVYPTVIGQSCGGAGDCSSSAPSDTSSWTNILGGSAYFSDGIAPVDPLNKLYRGQSYTYTFDGLRVCAWRLEQNPTHDPAVGDFCIPLQQS
jgi:type II secretory pathway pseudopilin PulG